MTSWTERGSGWPLAAPEARRASSAGVRGPQAGPSRRRRCMSQGEGSKRHGPESGRQVERDCSLRHTFAGEAYDSGSRICQMSPCRGEVTLLSSVRCRSRCSHSLVYLGHHTCSCSDLLLLPGFVIVFVVFFFWTGHNCWFGRIR